MKIAKVLLLSVATLLTTPAFADQPTEVAAAKLLDAMDMQKILGDAIDATLEVQLSQKPEMAPYKEIFRAFFARHMRYEVLKPKLAAVYAAEFSAAELDEAAAFYATPTGKKFLVKLPTLYGKGAEIGQAAVKDHLSELQEAIQAESRRLRELQKADKAG